MSWPRRLAVVAAAVALAGLALRWWLSPPRVGPNLVFLGGPVVTLAGPAEAVHVRDGRIAALGGVDEVLAAAGSGAQVIDLAGATLMPGLIEVHTHPLATALLGATVDVSGFHHRSRAGVMAALREAAGSFSLSKWILAFGWDPILVADLEAPTLAELDAIAPERPLVVLTQMMHDAFANSAALAAAGIDRDTADPPGGAFVRDAAGDLTGNVREVGAIGRLLAAAPTPPAGAADLMLRLQYGRYAAAGYTTLGVLGPVGRAERPIDMMAELAEDATVPVRTVVYALPDQLERGDWRPRDGNERFRLRGVKFWMDGSPYAGGAAFAEPYEDTPLTRERLHLPSGHMAPLQHERDEFLAAVSAFHRRGWQIAVHTQGERAIDRVLDVLTEVLREHPRPDARHRLEHNALITPAQLERAARLGVTTSFFIDHLYFYGARLPELVGAARTERYMPLGDALRSGHRATIHTDNPATPIDPFRAVQTAVRRVPRDGGAPLGASQRIPIEAALRALTLDAAWQLGMEEEVGSIEVGKRADFVVLSESPLEIDPARLTQIRVAGTWLDGQPVDTRPWSRANVRLALRMLWKMLR